MPMHLFQRRFFRRSLLTCLLIASTTNFAQDKPSDTPKPDAAKEGEKKPDEAAPRKPKTRKYDEVIDRLAKTFREAGRIAGDAGILACFEIEPVFVFNKEDHYMRILHGADHPSLKGIYDPSHFDQMNGATGKPEEMLQRVGPANIGYLQFCDSDSTLRDGGTSKHLACGDGRIDCAKSLQILKAGGFRGWIMADEWEVPDPYDACLKCKRLCDSVGRA